MLDKEKNNEMLSFDELRKQLGIDEDELAEIQKENLKDASLQMNDDTLDSETINELEDVMSTTVIEGKRIVENGKTFVDITEQFVFQDEKPPVIEENKEEVVTTVATKKRVRTFNEIFSDFFGFFIPLRNDSLKEKVRKIVMDISIVTIICCVIAFCNYFVEYQQNKSSDGNIFLNSVHSNKLDGNKYVEAWQEHYAQQPNMSFPEGMNSRYSYFYSVNQDLIGWLNIDTGLDVQVVQGDDNEYYLERDFYGKNSRFGCPFLDYKNETRELDDNTIIYLNHTTETSSFYNLDKYKTIEGYKQSPLITFSTLYETYTFKVFAAFISTDNPIVDTGFNYGVTDFNSDAKVTEFVDEVKSRSILNTDVSVQTDDKIITLVTSSHEFDGAIFVVMGRMIRENESSDININEVTLNTLPKYPQAWYDKKGIDNPYSK